MISSDGKHSKQVEAAVSHVMRKTYIIFRNRVVLKVFVVFFA